MPEQLSALVERVTYHDEESGFCVLKVRVRSSRDLVTVVGHLPVITPGETIDATGDWKMDRTHGRQFEAAEIHTDVPTNRRGIEKYLGSGVIKGIGSSLAKALVAEFGDKTLEVIESKPARLLRVAGIGKKRLEMIRGSWTEQKETRELMLFLYSHGVGTGRAMRIYKRYGSDTIRMISENPYQLADDVRGIGFLSADRIAIAIGFDRLSPFRMRAGLRHILGEALRAGHCALPREELQSQTARLLEIESPGIEQALQSEIDEKLLVLDTIEGAPAVFLRRIYEAEKWIARDLRKLAAGKHPWPRIDTDKAIPWAEKRIGFQLSPSQRSAVKLMLSSRVAVITGGPGVGKTTLVDTILRIVEAKNVSIALCAPTGRAAKRLTESTGREAKTIHRLLEVDPEQGFFRRCESEPIECDLLIVDEVSMVDVMLMDALIRALPPHAALLLVGDVDQLPSVGPGQVLADIIESGAVPVVRLTEIFRQAAESSIVVNAHRINRGMSLSPDTRDDSGESTGDFFFVRVKDPESAAAKVVQIVSERIPKRFGFNPMRDVQVLAPMYKGSAGVDALNSMLKGVLNPPRPGETTVERYGLSLSPGDKVMQLQNDYEKDVFNGDIGLVVSIDGEGETLQVDFDGRVVEYPFGDLDRLTLAYATTIHKSQGSEYPAVVIPIVSQHFVMLQRNLLYTAVTRGRKLVVIIGEERAVETAVRNERTRHRYSKLREWLRKGEV